MVFDINYWFQRKASFITLCYGLEHKLMVSEDSILITVFMV